MKKLVFLLLFTSILFACEKQKFTKKEEFKISIIDSTIISEYYIDQQRLCFCIRGSEPMRLHVINDRIVDGIWLTDHSVVSLEELTTAKTLKQLAEFVNSLNQANPYCVDIQYDKKYGFPSYIFVDYNEMIADEEIGYRTENLTIIKK